MPGPGGYLLWGMGSGRAGVPAPREGVPALGGSGQGGAWWRPHRMATAAGSTHPTGMHSCSECLASVYQRN